MNDERPAINDTHSLAINLFGPFEARVNGAPLRPLRSRKGQWLLALLTLRSGREVQREWLADTLWPDSLTDEAFASLRQSLADLRRALGEAASRLQSPASRTLRLDLTGAAVDVLAFDTALARGDPASLEQAVSLYRGPLLEGCAEVWILPEREAREQAYLQALEKLAAAAMAAGDPDAAARHLRRGAAIDPLRQRLHQALMSALGAVGQYQAAVEVYHELRHRLHRDFNTEPEPETQVLYQQLRAEARAKAGSRRQTPVAGDEALNASSAAEGGEARWGAREPTGLERGGEPPFSRRVDVPGAFGPPEPGGDAGSGERAVVQGRGESGGEPPHSKAGRSRAQTGVTSAAEAEAIGPEVPGGAVAPAPPLASDAWRLAPAPRHHLPVPPTRLIGREGELERLGELLTSEQARLVTLTGPGGTGKTRLALEAATGRLEAFPDGVFFVSLAPVREAGRVAAATVRALGLEVEEDRPAAESLAEYLRERRLLLLLDNFEQVLDAAPLVASLLAAAPRLRVLVTSRAALHLRGERLFPVAPLSVPGDQGVAQCPSVRLFVERAVAVRPELVLTPENAPVIGEICARLDGLPLAIELAAARMRLLSAEALLARLEPRLPLLTGGARDLPPRQQTLRGAIAWSYDLLSAGEQALFRRMSVFVGGFTLEAAERVCCDPGSGILDGLAALVDHSFLRLEDNGGGLARYGMLETVREFGLECLQASGEEPALRLRHAGYCLALAEAAELELTGAAQGEWLTRLDAEYGNLRAALEWCFTAVGSGVGIGLRLAGALGRYWQIRGSFGEGRELLARALAGADLAGRTLPGLTGEGEIGLGGGEAPEWGGTTGARAKAMSWAGFLAVYQGDYAVARSLGEESLALWRAVGDLRGEAGTLGCLAVIAKDQGERRQAEALFQESLALWRAVGDPIAIAGTLGYLGILAADEGDTDAARAFYTESLALRRERGDCWGIAASLNNLGLLALHAGDFTAARTLLAESLQIRRELGDRRCMVVTLNNLGLAACGQGDASAACALLEESLRLAREIGDRRSIAYSLEAFANVEGRSDVAHSAARWERVAVLCGAAEALREMIGAPLPPADRARHAPLVAAARAALDEACFAAARQKGRRLSLEEAIAFALKSGEGAAR